MSASIVPPCNLDAEAAVLSAIIIDSRILPSVRGILASEHFYSDANRHIFEALLVLVESSSPVDPVTLATGLRASGRLAQVGGVQYLAQLVDATPAVANAEVHARLVRDAWAQRQVLGIARRIAVDANLPVEELRERLRQHVYALDVAASSPGASVTNSPRPVLVALDTVAPQPVRWLWRGRIPLGKLTLLDGDPSLGKTAISGDIVARTSRGWQMPDGSSSDLGGPSGVVWLSAEDDPADTLRPRLDAAGGDPARVQLLVGVRSRAGDRLPTLLDVGAIERAIRESDARLLVVDPLMAYLGSSDSHRDQDIRSVFAPLAGLVARLGVALLVVRHLNKSGGGNPIYRGGGSIGIIGAARSGLLVGADPDDPKGGQRVLAVTKSNLAEIPPALSYRIDTECGVARIQWGGVSRQTAATLLGTGATSDERSAINDAVDWLREELADGPVAARLVVADARAFGISEMTLRRATKVLPVSKVKEGKPGSAGSWVWSLPGERL